MNFKSQREDEGRGDWLESFANNAGLSNELNNAYADDVIQAVEEKYFDTLESSLDDLRTRLGVTKAAMKDIKRIAIAKLDGKKKVTATETCKLEVDVKKDDEVPGNKEGELRLVKETEKVASGMNPGFQAYLDKKNGKKPKGDAKTEKKDDKKDDKKEDAKASFQAKKKAWFQGANEPTKEGEVTTNDPAKMGFPKEMAYDKKPMETTAPGGQDTRPAEQNAFEGAAIETKKELGPSGEEFKLKVEMQRIPEGEKEANASAWAKALKKSGSEDGAKFVNHLAWKKAIEKKSK